MARTADTVQESLAGSASSSLTSSSHTLTAFPPASSTAMGSVANGSAHPSLVDALEPSKRHVFIQPEAYIPSAAVQFAKETLDGFAATISEEQAQRLQEGRKKRKRGTNIPDDEVLRIKKIHTQGFEVEQVWEQAKRVIEALRSEVLRDLDQLGLDEQPEHTDVPGKNGDVKLLDFDEDGFEVGSDDDGSAEDDEEQDGSEDEDEEDEMAEDASEGGEEIGDEEEFEEFDDEEDDDEDNQPSVYVEDPNKLNDGFFSIDDFNKQTQFLEQQDASGDPYTGEASDEEEIDWTADPNSIPAGPESKSKSKRKTADEDDMDDEEESEDDEDEDGPVFGDMDLDAPEGASDLEDMDEEDVDGPGQNTNDIFYKDFFAPPARKASKGDRQAKYLERQQRKAAATEEDEEADIERAMGDVRRDLFDDESEQGSDDDLSDLDPSDPKSRKSAHERKQAKLMEEIRRLEAASVAKREWTLAGEARAVDRPQNSLLEEDMDFERTGKPLPVITAEISESIEELIKRRILAQEFDEVIKRRPDSLDSAPVRRGAFELDDGKPKQSLAEMYEEEHVKNNNPDTYMSKADEKLKAEHAEIEQLWKEVSSKLDALSSWHYKPKAAIPSLAVVSDVATIAMEDAQPTTAAGIGGSESMLAPQEIYKAGQDKSAIESGEVVLKSGVPVARQEMSREEKIRRRRREKERIKKRGGLEAPKNPESKAAKQKAVVGDLKKAGVKVINKRGEIRDVDGNKVKSNSVSNGAGALKL